MSCHRFLTQKPKGNYGDFGLYIYRRWAWLMNDTTKNETLTPSNLRPWRMDRESSSYGTLPHDQLCMARDVENTNFTATFSGHGTKYVFFVTRRRLNWRKGQEQDKVYKHLIEFVLASEQWSCCHLFAIFIFTSCPHSSMGHCLLCCKMSWKMGLSQSSCNNIY